MYTFCKNCDLEHADYIYKEKKLCSFCLLELLESEKKIAVKNDEYFINNQYFCDEEDIWSCVDELLTALHIGALKIL